MVGRTTDRAAAVLAITFATGFVSAAAQQPGRSVAPVSSFSVAPSPQPTTRRFGGTRAWSQFVTMRDGVRLAVDVHLPKGLAAGERTATILHLSRYYRSLEVRVVWRPLAGFGVFPATELDVRKPLVKAGYSWVDVDVRGTGASFGHERHPLSEENVRDGADVIDWIVAQPWSAGVVGATGGSYDAMLATSLLRLEHPALRAVAARFGGWDLYEDVLWPGGLRAESLLSTWSRLVSALDHRHPSAFFGWLSVPFIRGVRPVEADLLDVAMAEHALNADIAGLVRPIVYRDDFPAGSGPTLDDRSPHTGVSGSAVPVCLFGGWFDGAHPRGQVRQYLASRSPASRLRLGPWFHAGRFNASPYADRRHVPFDQAEGLLRFFDLHLRHLDSGLGREAPVQYYTMGQERWKGASTWPPPGAVWKSLYFEGTRRLGPERPQGDEASDRYQVDPTVSTGRGSRWGLIVGKGGKRGYGDRRDVPNRLLSYTSAALSRPLEVTGHARVRLFVAANATDGAVFAYLDDVAPDGRARYVTEGQLRLLHRRPASGSGPLAPLHSFRRADGEPAVPGAVSEVVFDLLPVSHEFPAGHALRLSLAGADAGTFAAPLPAQPLVYEVHRDGRHPSAVELPTYP